MRIFSMLATVRPKKATMKRSSALGPSVTSSGARTPRAANPRRAASSMESPTNDQLSGVDTPGMASETLPGDHRTSGSVASQWIGLAIGMAQASRRQAPISAAFSAGVLP